MKASAVEISQWAVIFSLIGGFAFPAQSQAQPIAPAADGTGTLVNFNGNRYNITGGSLSRNGANLFHSFQRFGLSEGQKAIFLSNPNIRNIFGRVTGGEASYINGLIQVTGGHSNLFLMNPGGIVFGKNASLNVPAAFTATTASGIGFNSGWFNASGVNDYAALVGTPSAFTFSAAQPGAIANAGNLTLQPGNNLTLLGGTVINTGTLSSPGGNITIAAVPGANTVRISQQGHLLSLEMQPIPATAQEGASIDPLSLPQLLTGGGSESHATELSVNENGQVFLTGSGIRLPAEGGVAIASGTIDVSGQTAGAVNILGDKIGLIASQINASANNGGGTVLIGGDYRGTGSFLANHTFVSSDSTINANALDTGNGGKVIVWADKTTAFYGNINALGGTNGGNGGFVEISGKENLIFRGSVNLSAPNGTTGSLLLDPENITIVTGNGAAEDSEVAADSQVMFEDGTDTYTISETALESLDGNAEVKLEASNDITIQPLSDRQLTFAPGTGSITFTADADRNGIGAFSMNSTDTIRAEGRNVTISAARINLGNIDTSSAGSNGGAIALNALSDIVTGSLRSSAGGSGYGGAIALTSANGFINTSAGTLDSSSVDGNGGAIALTAEGDIITNSLKSAAGEIISLGTNEYGSEQFSSNGGSGTGGNITLESRTGAIDTTAGEFHSYSLNNNGGNITLVAAEAINLRSAVSSSSYQLPLNNTRLGSGSGKGGDIAITSNGGGVSAFSGFLESYSLSGDGGNITITASGDINTYYIGSSSNGFGSGGEVILTSRAGKITSDRIFSNSISGNGGDVRLAASAEINASTILSSSSGSGAGGDIAITSSAGAVNTAGVLSTSSRSGDGGKIAIAASGDIKIGTMLRTASNSGRGGDIALTSTSATINTIESNINSSSTSGTAGNITLTASGLLSVGNINASGGLQGGTLTLTSHYSNVDTTGGTLDVSSTAGTAGNIAIAAYSGSIAVGNLGSSKNLAIADGGSDNPLSTDADASIISDADNLNNLTGSVSLAAHNDITVSEPISTRSISSLELRAGRSIAINADIDTSGGNGNIILRSNDNGADITRRDSGAGNITMAPDTSLSAGRGNITLELGTLAEIGTITLANLDTTGTVNINAVGGNVRRASDSSLIVAGSGIFQTTGTGSLGVPEQPLRLNLNNLEATAGSGGAFFDSPSRGVTVGGATTVLKGISTFGGGNLRLTASGDIVVTEEINTSNRSNAGNIELTSLAGSINTALSKLFSYSNETDAGAVTLTANADINVGEIRSFSWKGKGGDIAITSLSGAVNTSSGGIDSYSMAGDGGNIALAARGDITTASFINSSGSGKGGDIAISSRSGAINTLSSGIRSSASSGNGGSIALAASGNIQAGFISSHSDGRGTGGNITLTSTLGGIDNSSSSLNAYSSQGNAGSVSLSASGDIKITQIISSSGGSGIGGNISITSSSGSVATNPNNFANTNLENTLVSYSELGGAGNVTVSAGGSVTIRGIRSDGDASGGNIRIASGNAINTTTGAIASYSEMGIGGDVILQAQNQIEAGNIATYGNLKSGNVTILSGYGSIATDAIETIAASGNSGSIALNTFTTNGNINTANITSSGSLGAGNITVDSAGNVTTSNVSSTSSFGSSGTIIIRGNGDVNTSDVTSSGNTSAGEVAVSSGGNVMAADVSSNSGSGASGNVSVGALGDVTTGNVFSSGNTSAGSAAVTGGRNVSTGNIGSFSGSGASGNASVTALGSVTTGNITSQGNSTSGTASVTALGSVTTGNVSAQGTTRAGDAIVSAGELAKIGNLLSVANAGTSGNAIVKAAGSISAGNVLSIGTRGAGNVLVTSAAGNVTAGNLESLSESGNAGSVTVTAYGNIIAGNLRSQGSTGAGDISLSSAGGSVATGNLESFSSLGNAGNITVGALYDIVTGDISSVGGNNSGDIHITSREGAITTGDIETRANTGTAGEIALSAKNGVTAGELNSTGALGNGRINVTEQTGEVETEKVAADSGKVSGNRISNNLNTPEGSSPLNISNPRLTNNVIAAIAPEALLEEIETARLQEFTNYFEQDMPDMPTTLQSAREALSAVERQTGMQSAIAYVNAHPEQLEIVLFTAQGQPIRKSIPAAKREIVLKVAKEFREQITDPRKRHATTYLPSAQQLYQWLIAPIEPDLQAEGIDTLLFSMDAGLRSLPLAALHDGKQFLVEKYSLALIPSVSLMDARYQSLQKTQVLAFGVSDFADLAPLPAVPLELKAIAKKREGLTFLNEAFTLDNLKQQRQRYPYQIVHLATHAEFVPGAIANSYIQLWDDKLGLDRLRSLRLNNPSVELLVLSACRTALGDEKAEMGFAGLAVLSGVKSALASLWYVSDVATLGLMSEFYHHLNAAPIKAEALRRAQLAMIRGDVLISEGTLRGISERSSVALPPELATVDSLNLSHPYYWSAFTTIGSPW